MIIKLIPIFSIILNFIYLRMLEKIVSLFFPATWLPFTGTVRTLILYLTILMFLYSPTGQRVVAFFAHGRNIIGREERRLEPIIERLKDRTDIRGYSKPVIVQYKILAAINSLTGKKIKSLDQRVNQIGYEFETGTVKVFCYDSLDIETNSYGNSIFISKGAIDTLEEGELTAVIYNEFSQIKYNIANKRLLHDANILIGRISAILSALLAVPAYLFSFFNAAISMGTGSSLNAIGEIFGAMSIVLAVLFLSVARLIFWKITKKYTQAPYMLYERTIFIDADRATHKAGFSKDMLSYLEKLYNFKLTEKNFSKIFVELRPLVAYRMNYFDNVLGKNSSLSENNYAWSSNYLERVQTLSNQKN